MNKKIFWLLVPILYLTFVLADVDTVYIRPITGTSLNTNTSYLLNVTYAANSDCSGVAFSKQATVVTDTQGIVALGINISNLTGYPRFRCEYLNGTLRKTHNMSIGLFESIYAYKNINGSENIYADLGKIRGAQIEGTLGWKNISDVPAACAEGSQFTDISGSGVCTVLTSTVGNFSVNSTLIIRGNQTTNITFRHNTTALIVGSTSNPIPFLFLNFPSIFLSGNITGTYGNFTNTINARILNATDTIQGNIGMFTGAVTTGSLTATIGNFSGNVNVLSLNSTSSIFSDFSFVRAHSFNGTFMNLTSTATARILNATDTVQGNIGTFGGAVTVGSLTSSGALTATTGNFSGNVNVLSLNSTGAIYNDFSFIRVHSINSTHINNSGRITVREINITETLFLDSGSTFTAALITGTSATLSGSVNTSIINASKNADIRDLNISNAIYNDFGFIRGHSINMTYANFTINVTTQELNAMALVRSRSGIFESLNSTAGNFTEITTTILVSKSNITVGSALVITGNATTNVSFVHNTTALIIGNSFNAQNLIFTGMNISITNASSLRIIQSGSSLSPKTENNMLYVVGSYGATSIEIYDEVDRTNVFMRESQQFADFGTSNFTSLRFITGDTSKWYINSYGNLISDSRGGTLQFSSDSPTTIDNYEIGRNSSQFRFTAPSGASFNFSINGITQFIASNSQIQPPTGSIAAPQYSSLGDLDTGSGVIVDNTWGVSTGGLQAILIDSSRDTFLAGHLNVSRNAYFFDGNVSNPSISYRNDQSHGFYRNTTWNSTVLTIGHTDIFSFNETQFLAPNGSFTFASTPGISFFNDRTTGFGLQTVGFMTVVAYGSQIMQINNETTLFNQDVSFNQRLNIISNRTVNITFIHNTTHLILKYNSSGVSSGGGEVISTFFSDIPIATKMKFLVINGNFTAPAYSFLDARKDGFYRDPTYNATIFTVQAENEVNVTFMNATSFLIPTGSFSDGGQFGNLATLTMPGLAFINDSGTGIARNPADGSLNIMINSKGTVGSKISYAFANLTATDFINTTFNRNIRFGSVPSIIDGRAFCYNRTYSGSGIPQAIVAGYCTNATDEEGKCSCRAISDFDAITNPIDRYT